MVPINVFANIAEQDSLGWNWLLYRETKASRVSTGPRRYVTVPKGILQFGKQFLHQGLSHGSFGSCGTLGGGWSFDSGSRSLGVGLEVFKTTSASGLLLASWSPRGKQAVLTHVLTAPQWQLACLPSRVNYVPLIPLTKINLLFLKLLLLGNLVTMRRKSSRTCRGRADLRLKAEYIYNCCETRSPPSGFLYLYLRMLSTHKTMRTKWSLLCGTPRKQGQIWNCHFLSPCPSKGCHSSVHLLGLGSYLLFAECIVLVW